MFFLFQLSSHGWSSDPPICSHFEGSLYFCHSLFYIFSFVLSDVFFLSHLFLKCIIFDQIRSFQYVKRTFGTQTWWLNCLFSYCDLITKSTQYVTKSTVHRIANKAFRKCRVNCNFSRPTTRSVRQPWLKFVRLKHLDSS